MESQINTDDLIDVIKRHPIIYDTDNKEYYDRLKKKLHWDRICAILNPAYDVLDDEKKMLYARDVQKRWQNLRDCFRRDLVLQNQSPIPGRKRKSKYKYYDALHFLVPFTQPVRNDGESAKRDTEQKDDEESSADIDTYPNDGDCLFEIEVPDTKRPRILQVQEFKSPAPREESVADCRRFVDDDEAFLFSLMPSFKKYNQEEKFKLRIEIMKTILNFEQTMNAVKVERVADDEEFIL